MSEMRIGDVLWISADTPRYPEGRDEFPLRVTDFLGQRTDGRIYVEGRRLHLDTSTDLEAVRVLVTADHPQAWRRWGPPIMPPPRRLPVADSVLLEPAPPPGYTRRYPPP